mgnify:CR=1 FL=1
MKLIIGNKNYSSWALRAWLAARDGKRVAPPALGAAAAGYPALEDAPGRYVHEK